MSLIKWSVVATLVVALVLFAIYGVLVATTVSAALLAVFGIFQRARSAQTTRQGEGD